MEQIKYPLNATALAREPSSVDAAQVRESSEATELLNKVSALDVSETATPSNLVNENVLKDLHAVPSVFKIGLDALASFALADGPCTWAIDSVKKIGDKLLVHDADSDNKKELKQLASGLGGVFLAERSIGKLDPYLEKFVNKLSDYLQIKNPKFISGFDSAVDSFVRVLTAKFIDSFMKIDKESNNSKSLGGMDFSKEFYESLTAYKDLKESLCKEAGLNAPDNNTAGLEEKKFNLVKKSLNERFQFLYGKDLPKSMIDLVDALLLTTKNNHPLRQFCLLCDEAALALKPVLDRTKGVGTAIFTLFYNIVPNSYLLLRGVANYLLRDIDKLVKSKNNQS